MKQKTLTFFVITSNLVVGLWFLAYSILTGNMATAYLWSLDCIIQVAFLYLLWRYA